MSGQVIYVAQAGSDTAIGSSSAPMSLVAANAFWADGSIGLGDSVLFHRGDLFSGVLSGFGFTFAGRYMSIGAYGHGPMPVVSAYKILNTSGGWTLHASGIWKIDLTNSATHTGFNALAEPNIGHLLVDGVIYGKRVWATGDLASQWDFYCDATYLYVKSSANPTTLCTDLKAAPNTICVPLRGGVQVTGLDFMGSGGHGVSGTATDSRVVGNRFRQIGGSKGGGDATTRYGNAVQVFIGSSVVDIDDNVYADTYDVAYTLQGQYIQGSTGSAWVDVHSRRCKAVRCGQSIELWNKNDPDHPTVSGGFSACTIDDFRSFAPGEGWSHGVRPDPESDAHIITYSMELAGKDISIRRGVFHSGVNSTAGYRKHSTGISLAGIKFIENTVILPAGAPVERYGATVTVIETAAPTSGWTSGSGASEQGSTFAFLPASDPLARTVARTAIQQSDHDGGHRASNRISGTLEATRALALAALDLADGSSTRQTNQSSTALDYAKLATLGINGANSQAELVLGYSMPSAGTSPGNGGQAHGTIKIRLDAQRSPKQTMYIQEIVPFGSGATAIKRSDFHLVQTVNDTTNNIYEAQLFVFLRKTFQAVRTWPIEALPGKESYSLTATAGAGVWKLHNAATLVTSLPAGTDLLGTATAVGTRRINSSQTLVTVVNTTAETDLARFTIPAGEPQAGDLYILEMWGDWINNSGSAVNFTVKSYFGASAQLNTGAVSSTANANRRPWECQVLILISSASVQQIKGVFFGTGTAGGTWAVIAGANMFIGNALGSEDTTAAVDCALTVTMGTAASTADMRCKGSHLRRVIAPIA